MSRAVLLTDVRRERENREAQRRKDSEEASKKQLKEDAVRCIQRVYRGHVARRIWLDEEWKSLQKQVRDLEQLADLVRKKGQNLVAPGKVLLPLLCRARAQSIRSPCEKADIYAKLGSFATDGLCAPLGDLQRGLCGLLEATRPPHAPDPGHVLLRFSEALLTAVVAAGSAPGANELAGLLDAQAWAQGKGLQESAGCRQLAARLLASALEATSWPAGARGAPRRLKAWRSATTTAISAWPGGGASVSPRLQGLVSIGTAWLRLAGLVGDTTAAAGCYPAAELLESIVGVPRIGMLLSAAVGGASVVPWAQLLRAYAESVERGEGLEIGGCGERHGSARALDREYALVYISGNLWEVHAGVGLPLEQLLRVQSLLAKHLEVSMLPGFPAPSLEEPLVAQALRMQFRHFADPSAIPRLFSRVLHLQPRRGSAFELAGSTPYQRHCVAVAMHEVSPAAVTALCCIFSIVLLKARASIRASKGGVGTQVYFGVANAIAYMEGGDMAKVLWRFITSFYNWRSFADVSQPPECFHVFHLHATVLSQLLSVMSHDELCGPSSPLSGHDLSGYISHTTQLAARLIWDGSATDATPPPTGAGAGPRGALLEALLEQLGKILSQLHSCAGRLSPGRGAPPPETWHAPQDILEEFRRATETGNSQIGQKRACAERLLRYVPHAVPFEQRVSLLRSWIQEKRDTSSRAMPVVRLVVRRTHIFEDGLAALANADWQARFQVVFVNAAGLQEQGQDVGGLFKEFWEKLAETAFNPDYGLFRATDTRQLFPSPEAGKYHAHVDRLFEFLGLVIGKAIYEGIVVEPSFAPFFLAKLLGRHNSYYDLQTLDPALFGNLQQLKSYEGNVSDLCCSFVANSPDGEEVPLQPNGQNVPVTNENRFKYVYLLSDYKLNVELRASTAAFLSGFQRLLDEHWLRMFGEDELQQIISGGTSDVGLDVVDLQRHTQYSNCSARDKVAVDFFKALTAMDPKQRVAVLRFVTSCSRTPLLGFSHLVPPFTLHKVNVRSDAEKLPTSSTCFNTLKLPCYSSWKVTRKKLEFVIEQDAGFELD